MVCGARQKSMYEILCTQATVQSGAQGFSVSASYGLRMPPPTTELMFTWKSALQLLVDLEARLGNLVGHHVSDADLQGAPGRRDSGAGCARRLQQGPHQVLQLSQYNIITPY